MSYGEEYRELNIGDQVAIFDKCSGFPFFGTVSGIIEERCDSKSAPGIDQNQSEQFYEVYLEGDVYSHTKVYRRGELCVINRYVKVGSIVNVLSRYISNDLVSLDKHFSEETGAIVRNKQVFVTLQMLGNPLIIFVDVPISRLEPVSRYLKGDIVTCNSWIGKVLGIERKIILLHLESNKTYNIEEDLLLSSIEKQNPFGQFQLHEGQDLKSISFNINSPFINGSFERIELLSGCRVKHIMCMSMDVDWKDCLSPKDKNSKPPLKIKWESNYTVDRMVDFDKSIGIGDKFLMTPQYDDLILKIEDFYNNWCIGFEKRDDLKYFFHPQRMFFRSFRVVCTRTILDCILMNGKTFKLDSKKIFPCEISIANMPPTPLPNEIVMKSYDIDENNNNYDENIGQILKYKGDNLVNVIWQNNSFTEESYFSLSRSKYNYAAGKVVKFNSFYDSSNPTFGYFLFPIPGFRCFVKDPRRTHQKEVHQINKIQAIDMGEDHTTNDSDDLSIGYNSNWELEDFLEIFPYPINENFSNEVPTGVAQAILAKSLPMDFDGKLKEVLIDGIKEFEEMSPDVGMVHCYLERIDVISMAIFGSPNTVYEFYLFLFDVWLPQDFPNAEPEIYYRSFSKKGWIVSPLIDINTGRLDLYYLHWNSNMNLMSVVTFIREIVFCKNPGFLYEPQQPTLLQLEGDDDDDDDTSNSRPLNEEIYLHLVDSSYNQLLSPPLSLSPYYDIFESYINCNIETQNERLNQWDAIDNINPEVEQDLERFRDFPLFPLLPLTTGAMKTLREIINKCIEIRHLDLDENEYQYEENAVEDDDEDNVDDIEDYVDNNEDGFFN